MKLRELRGGPVSSRSDCSTAAERLADQIQDEDRLRLLEPTSLPKELRGRRRSARANTAVLTRIALEAFKARLWAEGRDVSDEEAARLFADYR